MGLIFNKVILNYKKQNSYLRNFWNWLDFIIIITGWMDNPWDGHDCNSLSESVKLSSLRSLRVLRPLRTI